MSPHQPNIEFDRCNRQGIPEIACAAQNQERMIEIREGNQLRRTHGDGDMGLRG